MSVASDLLEKINSVTECKNYGKTATSADSKVSGKIKDLKDGKYIVSTDDGDQEVPEDGAKVE